MQKKSVQIHLKLALAPLDGHDEVSLQCLESTNLQSFLVLGISSEGMHEQRGSDRNIEGRNR